MLINVGNKQTLKDQLIRIKCVEHDKQIIQLGLDQNLIPQQRPLCEFCGQKAIMIPISIDRAIVMLRKIQQDEDVVNDKVMAALIDQCLNGGDRQLVLKDISTIGTLLSKKFSKVGDNFIQIAQQTLSDKEKTQQDMSALMPQKKKMMKRAQPLIGNQKITLKESTKYEGKSGIEWQRNIIETETGFISSSFSPSFKVWTAGKPKEYKLENQFLRCILLFGEELIASYADNAIRIWKQKDGVDWTVEQSLKDQHVGEVWSILTHFETFITGSLDKTIKVFSKLRKHSQKTSSTYKQYQTIEISDCPITCMAIREDLIAAGTKTGIIAVLLYTDHWEQRQILRRHTKMIECVAFKPDQNIFVTGSDDKLILIWEQDSSGEFECVQEITDHSSYVFCLSFHPTYAAFMSGGLDQKLLLYGLDSRGRWVKHQEHIKDNPVTLIQFSRDSRRFYLGTSVGSIILYDIEQNE